MYSPVFSLNCMTDPENFSDDRRESTRISSQRLPIASNDRPPHLHTTHHKMSNLKRQRTDDSDTNATTNVFSQQRRGFSQHPVLAPAPGPPAAVVGLGPTAFEQLQVEASIANSMQQYAAAHASGQAFGWVSSCVWCLGGGLLSCRFVL